LAPRAGRFSDCQAIDPSISSVIAFFRGSAIAAAVSNNVLKGDFDSRVHIYVYDEMIQNSVLSEVINSRHENVKYLPGIKLPTNLVRPLYFVTAIRNRIKTLSFSDRC